MDMYFYLLGSDVLLMHDNARSHVAEKWEHSILEISLIVPRANAFSFCIEDEILQKMKILS